MQAKSERPLFERGGFFIGCNYWASNAGTNMWKEFDEAAILADFERLAARRVRVLRVFPLWSDFQPLRLHRGGGGAEREVRRGEEPLDHTPEGVAGVDPVMIERFRAFCDLAARHGMRLIVGLLTGWMSGRLHAPEMLQDKNLLADPLALKWEIKFVRYMVRAFRDCPAIEAWDLGNECNCMAPLAASEQAFAWTAAISDAIRAEDGARMVLSGMHSLSPDGVWRMQDQAENLDVLCTHPYPLFTPHCDTDPINRMKPALHAAAESRFYADLGGKPCFCEEAGTLGPMFAGEEIAADYVTCALFTLLAHDCRGFLWWCANEQSALGHTPYDWNAVERELGLFRLDGAPKPVARAMEAFDRFVEQQRLTPLPEAIVDAVCVLSRGQDCWAAAYGAFILAKQAGLNLRFCYADGPLPEARAYLLPALSGDASLPRRMWLALAERARAGATIYLSLDDALLSPFTELTGMRVLTRQRAVAPAAVSFDGAAFELVAPFLLTMESAGARVLARDADGRPVFSACELGAGRVFLLNYPIERLAATAPGIVDSPAAQPLYKFYRALGIRSRARCADCNLPTVGLTEHPLAAGGRVLIAVNYEPCEQRPFIALEAGRDLRSVASIADRAAAERREGGALLTLPGNSAAVLRVE